MIIKTIFSTIIKITLSLFLFINIITFAAAKDRVIVMSDFDYTVTSFAWDTKLVLTRSDIAKIEAPQTGAIQTALKNANRTIESLPLTITISQLESEELLSIIAKDDGNKWLEIASSGEKILPSLYEFITPSVYHNFQTEGQLAIDYSKVDTNKILKNNPELKKYSKKELLFSAGFFIIEEQLKNPDSRIYIHTARGQNPQEFQNLFKGFVNDDLLDVKNIKDVEKISFYPLSRLEHSKYGPGISNRKMNFLDETVRSVITSQSSYDSTHFIFLEDNINFFTKAYNQLQNQSNERHWDSKVYFHLFYTGSVANLTQIQASLLKGSGAKGRAITFQKGIPSTMSKEHRSLLGLPNNIESTITNISKAMRKPIHKCLAAFK